jgi:hypothetical protein
MNWKIAVGGVLGVLFLGTCFFLGEKMDDPSIIEEGGKPKDESRVTGKSTQGVTKKKREKKPTVAPLNNERISLKRPTVNLATNSVVDPTEKKGLDDLQLALDNENLEKVRAASAALARSPSPYVRGKVVESLRWFKQPAVVDLRGMLRDSDAEVAGDAQDGWLDAVKTIADEETKAKELYEGMTQIQDVDALRESVMEFYDLDDGLALPYIVNLINSGNPGAKQVGNEAYEHIAGEAYTTPEAAQKWVDVWRKDNPLPLSTP